MMQSAGSLREDSVEFSENTLQSRLALGSGFRLGNLLGWSDFMNRRHFCYFHHGHGFHWRKPQHSAKGAAACHQSEEKLAKCSGGALDTATVLRGFLNSCTRGHALELAS